MLNYVLGWGAGYYTSRTQIYIYIPYYLDKALPALIYGSLKTITF